MAASPFNLATPERASRLLRLLILVLLVLVPVAAIYALVMGGAGGNVMVIRSEDGMTRLEDLPPPGMNRQVIEQCTLHDGAQKCTRTEHLLKPGEQLAPPPAAVPAPPAPQHSNFIKASFTPPGAGAMPVGDTRIERREGPPPDARGIFNLPLPPAALGAGGVTLSVLALLLVMGILFNLEWLLQAFETGAVFAQTTVRRLQHVGLFVAALGFLPQIDIFALLRNAGLSLITPAPVGPLPLIPGGGINIALVLAGVFTVLIARIVHEANALAEDVRGTV